MRIYTDEACLEYERAGHPESPRRVRDTLAYLRELDDLPVEWCVPPAFDDSLLADVHDPEHVAALDGERDFDADTPAHAGIGNHARTAVAGALAAMDSALAGIPSFSLLRPPGHHACPQRAMGFCYLNQIAACAVRATERGLRVAVVDFDVHHGNGTEAILLGRPDTLYVSVHQSPAYPGTGIVSRLNCRNHPMRPDAPREAYLDALRGAIDEVEAFSPDLIAVSAGFDAFRGDPLAQENLEPEDFADLARSIRALGAPTFAVLEGGYSRELPMLVHAYLDGLADPVS